MMVENLQGEWMLARDHLVEDGAGAGIDHLDVLPREAPQIIHAARLAHEGEHVADEARAA